MRTSWFGALFGTQGPRPATEIAPPSVTLSEQLAALKGTLDLRESSLARLRDAQRRLQDENDSLRVVYVQRTEEVLALRKEVDRLQHQLGIAAPASSEMPPIES